MFKKRAINHVVSVGLACHCVFRRPALSEIEPDESIPKLKPDVLDYLSYINCTKSQRTEIYKSANAETMSFLNRLATEDSVLSDDFSFESLWERSPLASRYKHDNENCVLFWKNFPTLTDLLVVKLQSDNDMGTCHAQAAVTLQHYEVSINRYMHYKSTANVGMITVPSLLRHQLHECGLLRSYLLHPSGGRSLADLQLICGLSSPADISVHTLSTFTQKLHFCEHIKHRLRSQSALISHFHIIPGSGFELCNGKVSFQISDIPSDCKNAVDSHAMVLIGMRVDESGQYWFLLQNWWRCKPFVEVTYEYLMAAGASLTFINKLIEDIPQIGTMSRTYHKSLETAVDSGDAEDPEK